MQVTTRNDAKRPGVLPNVVDVVNTVNTPVSRRNKSYFKTVVGTFFIVLAVLAMKYSPSASADIGSDYNDGLKTTVCSMLDKGMGREYVVTQLQESFADLAAKMGQPMTRRDWTVFENQAIAEKCPTYSEHWND